MVKILRVDSGRKMPNSVSFLGNQWKWETHQVLDAETATKLSGKRDHDNSIPQNAIERIKSLPALKHIWTLDYD